MAPLAIGKSIVIPSTFREIYVYGTSWKGDTRASVIACEIIIMDI